MILGIGAPRSGTGYLAKFLQAQGYDVGHERMGRDGIVCWSFAVDADAYPPAVDTLRRNHEWTTVIHVVRYPLDVIGSMLTATRRSLSFIDIHCGGRAVHHADEESPMGMLARLWLGWTALCENCRSGFGFDDGRELVDGVRLRIESDAELDGLAWRLNGGRSYLTADADCLRTYNTRPHPRIGWEDIPEPWRTRVQERAREYGYELERP